MPEIEIPERADRTGCLHFWWDDRRLVRLYIKPQLQSRIIGEVKRVDIARLHHDLRHKPYQANRVLALLSGLFNWAEKHGVRPDSSNPCRHVQKYRERKRARFLSQAELAQLGDVLRQAEQDQSCSPWAIAAIRLLVLTGARRNEILTLRWEQVNREHESLLLPDCKTGKKAIHLNAPATAVLEDVQRLEGNPYVICGERPGRHLVNLEKPWRRLRKAAKLEGVRLHDLRHSFASVAAMGGMSLPVIGAMLGHTKSTTTARYAHLADDPVKAASDAVGRRIALALDKGKSSGEVVEFGKTRSGRREELT